MSVPLLDISSTMTTDAPATFDVVPGEMTFDWADFELACDSTTIGSIDDLDSLCYTPTSLEASLSAMMASSAQNTPSSGSNHSPPTDFAFGPPSAETNYNAKQNMPPPSQTGSFSMHGSFSGIPGYFGAGSSFSSTSGNTSAGGSFSSSELPPISHDFAPPSTSETRRPATAAGALQSGWGRFTPVQDRSRTNRSSTVAAEDKPGTVETIDESGENGVFTDPFASSTSPEEVQSQPMQSGSNDSSVDPHYNPGQGNRSNDNQLPASSSWSTDLLTPSSSTPSMQNMSNFNYLGQLQSQAQQTPFQRPTPPMSTGGRPQTSDGIPQFGGFSHQNVSLPSARTITSQFAQPFSANYSLKPGFSPSPSTTTQQQPISNNMPFREARLASMPEFGIDNLQGSSNYPANRAYSLDNRNNARPSYLNRGESSELTFVSLGGPAPKKRPRRRYDEIERLYGCGWNGCEKSYGTLNHLNAHVAMQKHGEKRLPTGEFPS